MFFNGGTEGDTDSTRLGPRFHQVWVSVTVSSLGDGMRFVALPLLATRVTGDPRQIAAVSLAEQLPWLLLGLLSGALADRVDRRVVLWTVDAVRALLVGGFACAVAAGGGLVTVPLLCGVGFLLGCGQTLYNGAWSGMVPALVGPGALARANARLQAGALVTDTLLGTPLGAVLFGVAAALPFAVDAASFALAAALVLPLRGDFRPRPAGARDKAGAGAGAVRAGAGVAALRGEIAEGVRWLVRNRVLRRLCVVSAVSNLVGGGLIAILVLYARRTLGLHDLGFALLVAAFAVGGIAGAAVTPRLTARIGAGRLLRLATLGTALVAVATGAAGSGPVAAVCIAGYGATSVSWNVVAVTLRQSLVPGVLLGRVTMACQMVVSGAGASGAVAAGLVAHGFGLRAPFFVGAALLFAVALVGVRPDVAAQHVPPQATIALSADDVSRGSS